MFYINLYLSSNLNVRSILLAAGDFFYIGLSTLTEKPWGRNRKSLGFRSHNFLSA